MAKKKKVINNNDAEGIVFIALGTLCFLSLMSFSFLEPKMNWLGYVGYTVALGTEYIFGLAAYLIPFYCIWVGVKLLQGQKKIHLGYDHIYFLIFICCSSLLLTVIADTMPEQARSWEGRIISESLTLRTPYPRTFIRYNLGGIPFYYLYSDFPILNLKSILSAAGTALIFTSLGLVSFLLLTRVRLLANLRIFWNGARFIGRMTKKSVQLLMKIEFSKAPKESNYSGLPKASGLKINLPEEKKVEPKKAIAQLLKPPLEKTVKTSSPPPESAPCASSADN